MKDPFEVQESEQGEAALHYHFERCKKNPTHKEFVPVCEFTVKHLPNGYRDNDLLALIKATADLTVRVTVQNARPRGPGFRSGTSEPYSFSTRDSGAVRTGTGTVLSVYKYTEKDRCTGKDKFTGKDKCKEKNKCTQKDRCTEKDRCTDKDQKKTCKRESSRYLDTSPKDVGEVRVFTATHLICGDKEARHITCRFFFDRDDSPLVTLDGWTVDEASVQGDLCVLKHVLSDVHLLDRLYTMDELWFHLCDKVITKYWNYRSVNRLNCIVSHPHGCSKHISVGRWIDRSVLEEERDGWANTKYTYTTCTCPGSSGAYVFTLGCIGLHTHSGVDPEGRNYCGISGELTVTKST